MDGREQEADPRAACLGIRLTLVTLPAVEHHFNKEWKEEIVYGSVIQPFLVRNVLHSPGALQGKNTRQTTIALGGCQRDLSILAHPCQSLLPRQQRTTSFRVLSILLRLLTITPIHRRRNEDPQRLKSTLSNGQNPRHRLPEKTSARVQLEAQRNVAGTNSHQQHN